MNLSQHIEDVRVCLEAGRYSNEAAVSQGIVLRLLQALGWPTYNTQIVCPEFNLAGKRVDYALCYPSNKPVAFIEVKQQGTSAGAEKQLFEYAFHDGIQLAILTDGQEWNFFLPAEQGSYAERRVYKLDILERKISESVARLEKYLSHEGIISGEAIAAAREDYKNVSRSRQMRATLPEAWTKLIKDEDELLLELLADTVESLCGFKPDVDTVALFLKEHISLHNSAQGNQKLSPDTGSQNSMQPAMVEADSLCYLSTQSKQVRSFSYSYKEGFVSCQSGRDVLIKALMALAENDPSFLDRFAARPKHGRKRRYIARSIEELYPDRPDLAKHSHELLPGWYVGTNVSCEGIRKIIKMACEVSQVRFGQELIVNIEK